MGLAPLIIVLILALAHFIVEKYFKRYEEKHNSVVSFAVGVFLTFIFLELMPRLFSQTGSQTFFYLFIMMWGFIIFHLVEKHIYKNVKKYLVRYKEINELDIAAFLIDNLLIGFVIWIIFFDESILKVIILSIPFLMHIIASALSLNKIYDRVSIGSWVKLVVKLSVVFGAIIAFAFPSSQTLYLPILAFIIGALLFTVSRDVLPKYSKGNPMFFVIGNLVAILIIGLGYLL